MSAPMIRLDFRLPDLDLDLPAEMLAPPPSIKGLLFNRTALVIYALVLFGGGGLTFATWSLGQREARIRESLADLTATERQYSGDIARAEELTRRRAAIRSYLDTVSVVDEHRYAVVHALDQFDRHRPSDTWLERVETVREDSATKITILRLTGVTPSQDQVAEYQRRLEGSPWLRNVQFQSSDVVTVSGQGAVRFVLTSETRRPEKEFLTTESITSAGLISTTPRAAPATGPVLAPLDGAFSPDAPVGALAGADTTGGT